MMLVRWVLVLFPAWIARDHELTYTGMTIMSGGTDNFKVFRINPDISEAYGSL